MKNTAPIACRLARPDERPALTAFLDQHWGSQHPLIHWDDFFNYYYVAEDGALQFAVAEQDGQAVAVAGYIRANRAASPDIWVSIWCAKKGCNGAGLELMAALPRLTGARLMACNNIRPETMAFYTFLGYTAARLPHYYRLADKDVYAVARVEQKVILPLAPGPALAPVAGDEELARVFRAPQGVTPAKDLWYLSRRYFHFPGQQYDVWHLDGRLLVTRTVPLNGTAVLRVVDYVGRPEEFHLMGPGIARLMEEVDAEYAECYCAGVPAAEMAAAGFAERDEACPNIIPNYLTPPLYENTEYCYFTSDPDGFMLFKADGDQDRPNITHAWWQQAP